MFDQVNPVVQDFVIALLSGLLGLLCTFLLALAKKGFDFLGSKIDKISDEKAQKALSVAKDNLEDIVSSTVTSIQQTLVGEIKDSIKAKDSKYTRDDLLALGNRALESIKVQLTDANKEILLTAYSDLDAFIRDRIESKVFELKNNLLTSVSVENE